MIGLGKGVGRHWNHIFNFNKFKKVYILLEVFRYFLVETPKHSCLRSLKAQMELQKDIYF